MWCDRALIGSWTTAANSNKRCGAPMRGSSKRPKGTRYGDSSEKASLTRGARGTFKQGRLTKFARSIWRRTKSRRAAAGRAQLLAKKRHTGRVQNPGGVSENRPACGTAQHTLAVCFVFEKFWKNPEIFRLKFGEISGKFSQNLRSFGKKQQQFQQFLTKILRLETGAKECIV